MSEAAAASKDSFLNQIWNLSTTLTDEAMAAASAKALELGFDVNRGLIPLSESFINLSSARTVLEDAIEKEKLIQLPITVQKELLTGLEAISRSLQGLTGGVDEVVNLTNSIETLNTAIWKYGFHNLSDQVLGYQKKLNQLKTQEVQIAKMVAQLSAAEKASAAAVTTISSIEQAKSSSTELLQSIQQAAAGANDGLADIRKAQADSTSLFSTVQQNEKQSGELIASIRTANNELISLDTSIRKFYSEVDEYRRKIAQTTDEASKLITTSTSTVNGVVADVTAKADAALQVLSTSAAKTAEELRVSQTATLSKIEESVSKLVSTTQDDLDTRTAEANSKLSGGLENLTTALNTLTSDTAARIDLREKQLAQRSEETIGVNKVKTDALISELNGLKEQVREQIQQATGFALFGAFQSRQNQIVKGKMLWVYAIGALVVISAAVTAWIAYEAQTYTAHTLAFWVKLSLTVPLGYAITFCTVQYSKERRLEEEYAFKASISVSLNPYRDLIHSILEKDGQIDQSKYTEFVIGSVNNVFTSPTEKVFDAEKKPGVTKKTFKDVAEIIGAAARAAK